MNTIIFAGRHWLLLRGNQKTGVLEVPGAEPAIVVSEGNLRHLLQLKAISGGDNQSAHLKKNLQERSLNLMAVSICNGWLYKWEYPGKISKKGKTAHHFTVNADETRNVTRTEEFSIWIHFHLDGKMREEFGCPQDVSDIRAAGFAENIVAERRKMCLDLNLLVVQSYDGACTKYAVRIVIQAVFRQQFPKAAHNRCASHCLNLVICTSSNVQSISNSFLAAFFVSSCKSLYSSQKEGTVWEKS